MRVSGSARSALPALSTLFGAAVLLAACAGSAVDADLVLRGGTVIDGTGGDARIADVAVKDGRILDIGNLAQLNATREIDVTGSVVAPGFIDLHSHADLILLAGVDRQHALLRSKIAQGVTTILVGNCGLGVAPANESAEAILSAVNGWMTPDAVESGAGTTAEYLARLESGGVVLNVGTLIPHGPVRISAMGLASGTPSTAQLDAMRAAVEDGLRDGAFGLSTGLIYPPGMYSATGELVALAEVVARHDRLFTAHIRGSSETLLPATEELLEIGRSTGARVHHSHLEAVGRRFWNDVGRVLALEDAARAEGRVVSHDVFPYTRAATMMSAIFPPWSLEGGVPALLQRLEDPEDRRRIRRELENRVPDWPPWREGGWPHNLVGAVGWDGIIVASVRPDGPQAWVGRSLDSIADDLRLDPFDVVADLMIGQEGQVGQFVAEISGRGDDTAALLSILAHPAGAVISDAEDYGRGRPHPAHAGAFARALRLNRERELMPIEELVRKMTSYPASILGLEDRGEIRSGAHADLVVFDPDGVHDRATWEDPRAPAEGFGWVLVGGNIVVEPGGYVPGVHGRVLRATRTVAE